MAAGQVGAGALDGTGHGVDGLVLPDNVRFQGILQPLQAAILGLLDLDGRHAGPQLNDLRHIVHRDLDLSGLQLQSRQFFALLRQIGFDGGKCLIVDGGVLTVLRLGILQLMLAGLQLRDLALCLQQFGDLGVAQVAAGTGLVQQVDGLVRQETVGDIALRQLDDAGDDGVRHTDAVVLLVIDADALDDLDRIQ